MNELDIYKFLHDESKCKQCGWNINYQHGLKDTSPHLEVWVAPEYLRELAKLLGYSYFDDGGLDCIMCPDGCIYIAAFDDILEGFDIDPERIISKPADVAKEYDKITIKC